MASQYWLNKKIRISRHSSANDESTKTSKYSSWSPNETRMLAYVKKPGESKGLHYINGMWTLNCKGQLWTGSTDYKKSTDKKDEKLDDSKARKIREKFEQKDYGTKGLTMAVCDVTQKGDAIVMTSLE